MNVDGVIKKLRAHCEKHGSQAAAAIALDVSPAYLSDVLAKRRDPGDKVLRALGLEKRTSYQPTNGS